MIVKKVVVLLGILVVSAMVWNQGLDAMEQGEREKPSGDWGGSRRLELSLQSAVELGIKRNLDVVVETYYEKVATERITEERSIFDPVGSLRVETGEQENPIAEVFYDDGYIVQETDRSVLGLKGKIPTGATLGMDLSFERNESTSQIQTLSPRYTSRLNFTLTHPLLKDFGVGPTKTMIRLAEKGSERAKHEVLDRVMETVGAVEMAYWGLAYAMENLELKRESLDLAKKLYFETEVMVRAGEKSRINLIQAKTGVAGREEEVIIAESAARKAEYDLMLLLDLPDHGMQIVPMSFPEKSALIPDVDESLAMAWENHPRLKVSRAELEQQEIRVRYAKNQLLPRLDFIAEYGYNGMSGDPSDEGAGDSVEGTLFEGQTNPEDAFKNWFTNDAFDTWLLGLKFEAPWGNRQAKSRYTQAALDEKRLKTERRRLEEQIATQVKKAILDIKTAIKRMEATRAGVVLAQEQLDAEGLRFLAGEATSSDVLGFERELSDMRTKELKAIIDYNTAWSMLRVAEGVSLSHYDIEFDPS